MAVFLKLRRHHRTLFTTLPTPACCTFVPTNSTFRLDIFLAKKPYLKEMCQILKLIYIFVKDVSPQNHRRNIPFVVGSLYVELCIKINKTEKSIVYNILRIQFVTHIFIGSSVLNVSIHSENRRGIYFSSQKRLKDGRQNITLH